MHRTEILPGGKPEEALIVKLASITIADRYTERFIGALFPRILTAQLLFVILDYSCRPRVVHAHR